MSQQKIKEMARKFDFFLVQQYFS